MGELYRYLGKIPMKFCQISDDFKLRSLHSEAVDISLRRFWRYLRGSSGGSEQFGHSAGDTQWGTSQMDFAETNTFCGNKNRGTF